MDGNFTWIFLWAVLPTLVYLGVGLYILSLEQKKGPGYKLPALIYFISVPSIIVIIIALNFSMNYETGRFESANKPVGYELYKFLVLKDIIPRSGQSLDEKEETKVVDKKEDLNKSQELSKLNTTIDKELKTDEKYYALVIGNNNYQYLEKLDAAENDAKVIADVLENKYGFEVELLLNGDYSTTVDSIFNMTKKLKENDNLLIYYAGHGELDKSENRGYWLPVNASTKSRAEWISNQRIVDRVKATKAKHVLLMVDSCFSGSLMRGGELSEENETIDKKYIERLKKKKTRLVITSGGNEPVVDSDGGNHSLFALKLIDTLKNNDNVINSQILFENIRRYVVSNADQTPERAMVHKTGHDGGDFLFFPK